MKDFIDGIAEKCINDYFEGSCPSIEEWETVWEGIMQVMSECWEYARQLADIEKIAEYLIWEVKDVYVCE